MLANGPQEIPPDLRRSRRTSGGPAGPQEIVIDHSRSLLGTDAKMPYLDETQWCARSLYDGLKKLESDEMVTLLSPTLTAPEVDWMLARRDKIVARLDDLITEPGEAAVLF